MDHNVSDPWINLNAGVTCCGYKLLAKFFNSEFCRITIFNFILSLEQPVKDYNEGFWRLLRGFLVFIKQRFSCPRESAKDLGDDS